MRSAKSFLYEVKFVIILLFFYFICCARFGEQFFFFIEFLIYCLDIQVIGSVEVFSWEIKILFPIWRYDRSEFCEMGNDTFWKRKFYLFFLYQYWLSVERWTDIFLCGRVILKKWIFFSLVDEKTFWECFWMMYKKLIKDEQKIINWFI